MSGIEPEKELVLITCTAEQRASLLIPTLQKTWSRLRLAAATEDEAKWLREQYPYAEVMQANLGRPADTLRIMSGVSAVYHVGSTGNNQDTQCGYNMIDAAVFESRGGSFKHFVLSSILPTQLKKLMNSDRKRHVEDHLMESGLNYTILQPSHFFENTPVELLMQQEHPVYPVPYGPSTKFSFTAIKDLADVIVNVLAGRESHYFAVYPIISTTPMLYSDFVDVVARAIGKPITLEKKSFQESVAYVSNKLNATDDPTRMDLMERVLLYYSSRGLWGNPGVTEWLLQRKVTNCEEWANATVKAQQQCWGS